MRRLSFLATGVALALAGCNQNTAIGNDREADTAPPEPAAPIRSAGAALGKLSTALVKPETMSEADVAAIGGTGGRCVFRLTEVGYPAFVYEPDGRGFIKLDGTLIPVAAAGEGGFASGQLRIATRMLDGTGNAGLREMEMLVVPPGAGDELGYRGYVQCGGRGPNGE